MKKLFKFPLHKGKLSSGSNFKSFNGSLDKFFPTVGQNNFGNKIPFLRSMHLIKSDQDLKMPIVLVQFLTVSLHSRSYSFVFSSCSCSAISQFTSADWKYFPFSKTRYLPTVPFLFSYHKVLLF